MRDNLAGAVWRLAIFVMVCVLGIFAIFAIFAQLRFQDEDTYRAEFSDITGLKSGAFVRIAGVEVGKVSDISIRPDTIVTVSFTTDQSVVLTHGSRAVIRWDNPLGDRYLELQEGAGDTKRLLPGQTIPVSQTAPSVDLDALIGGFKPLFRALDPEQVNALTGQLIQALQGQGGTINSFLSQTAQFTSTLADRDDLIGQVIHNLNVMLGSLAEQNGQFDKAIKTTSELVKGLSARRDDITNAVAYTNAATGSIADLMSAARPPLRDTVEQTDRVAGLAMGDYDFLDHLLATLPDAYRALARQGVYGDFFSFYLCDLFLKMNGKGGQPVYIKMAGQDTGRCAPK
ncbi:phospholipid/cholesterol/gamma-HCH transport system substrate-binding protein [Mycobacterium sp. BK086]|uniref:MCE family protein n=1 Tax=Mycobacterium sp. BK086 TaxID=2512165 RepID=UPI00105FCA09|nr:MCE family protein [Mycobacterium sp. BK086]TDO10119.1 phospholipid/cholesterol/gamma-HCH transport system substrate-binding protein [Mycobacterium sp. BK086]